MCLELKEQFSLYPTYLEIPTGYPIQSRKIMSLILSPKNTLSMVHDLLCTAIISRLSTTSINPKIIPQKRESPLPFCTKD